jgi:hypothetical protein
MIDLPVITYVELKNIKLPMCWLPGAACCYYHCCGRPGQVPCRTEPGTVPQLPSLRQRPDCLTQQYWICSPICSCHPQLSSWCEPLGMPQLPILQQLLASGPSSWVPYTTVTCWSECSHLPKLPLLLLAPCSINSCHITQVYILNLNWHLMH